MADVIFKTTIGNAKFVFSPLSPQQMQRIGEKLLASVKARIKQGVNCDDNPARPLKPGRISKGKIVTRYGRGGKVAWTDTVGGGRQLPGYPDYKVAHGLRPIRDWIGFVGSMRMLDQMKVKRVDQNGGVIGFVDANADRNAYLNNLREKQFGVSPKDKEALNAAALEELMAFAPVQLRKVA